MSALPSMRSRLNWAVLGLLIERPSYGYELHQRIGRRFSAEVLDPYASQIYAALDVMERMGLVEPIPETEVEEAAGPPRGRGRRERQPKVHYRVTALGAQAFRAWLAQELRSDPIQAEFLERLALAAGMRRAGLMHELVDAYEEGCAREAQALPMAGADGHPARSPDQLMRRLTVAARRAMLDAQMGWFQYARKEIEAFERGTEADA